MDPIRGRLCSGKSMIVTVLFTRMQVVCMVTMSRLFFREVIYGASSITTEPERDIRRCEVATLHYWLVNTSHQKNQSKATYFKQDYITKLVLAKLQNLIICVSVCTARLLNLNKSSRLWIWSFLLRDFSSSYMSHM